MAFRRSVSIRSLFRSREALVLLDTGLGGFAGAIRKRRKAAKAE